MANLLDPVLWNNSLAQWGTALGLSLLVVLTLGLFKQVLIRRLARLAARTGNRIDDSLAGTLEQTRLWLWLVPAIALGARSLALPARVESVLVGVALVSVFVQVGLWSGHLLGFWIEHSRRATREADPAAATSLGALGFLAKVLLWSVLTLVALDNLGVDVTALVAGLGVGGIAVALATQNILGDLFASMSIVVDKPFVLGDFIIVGEYMGTVEKIGLKTTRIRSLNGEQIVFSNADLLNSRVRNYKRMYERRVVFAFGVVYETPVEQLEAIPTLVREAIDAREGVRFERAHFQRFGDSSYDFEVVYWVLSPDYNVHMDIQQAINLALVRAFAARRIEFAYPTRTLHMVATPSAAESASPGARSATAGVPR